MTRQHWTRLIAGLVLIGAGATACGDDEPSTDEATADVCDARDDVGQTIGSLIRFDASDTEKLREARDELGGEVDELSSAGQRVAESQWDDVEAAWDEFRGTVGDLGGDTSFNEAAEQLTDSREQLTDAWDSFTSSVSC